jgi:hypothetical protein
MEAGFLYIIQQPQRTFPRNAQAKKPPEMEQSGPRTDVESKQDLTARSRSEYSQDTTNDGYRRSGQRQRNESLHVSYSAEDVQRMAKEISEETIAPVHLSLLGWWIREKTEHYELAKSFIRELSLDQVSLQCTDCVRMGSCY